MTPIRKQITKPTTQKTVVATTAQKDSPVDTAAIALALKEHPRWIEAMQTIADYKRSQAETSAFNHRRTIHEKPKHTHWTYDDLAEVYSMLQEAGAGELVIKPNKEPVFEWHYYAKDIAKNAINLSKKTVAQIKAAPSFTYAGAVIRPHVVRKRPLAKGRSLRFESTEIPAPVVSSSAPTVSKPIHGDVIVVQLRGIEFELDLSQVPMELLKPRRIL